MNFRETPQKSFCAMGILPTGMLQHANSMPETDLQDGLFFLSVISLPPMKMKQSVTVVVQHWTTIKLYTLFIP